MAAEVQILVVEDDRANRELLERLLSQNGYASAAVESVTAARAVLGAVAFELVLCDMQLAGESGLDLLRELVAAYPDTAVLVVTGVDDPALAAATLQEGAYGYVMKPYRTSELLINVANALRRRDLELSARRQREALEQEVRERTRELRLAHEETVLRLAALAEHRDRPAGAHLQRMSRHCAALARAAGLDEARAEQIRIAALLHDVGKIAIPDALLHKVGTLDAAERAVMETHASIGRELLSGSRFELLDLAAEIAATHHERFDGSGYPLGLAGEQIPLAGRIAAIADVFDALTEDRPYRSALPPAAAKEHLRRGRGTAFDPELVDLFLGLLEGRPCSSES